MKRKKAKPYLNFNYYWIARHWGIQPPPFERGWKVGSRWKSITVPIPRWFLAWLFRRRRREMRNLRPSASTASSALRP